MSNAKALVAEVRSSLRKYSDAGLIDENSLYRDIEQGLKRFGNDVMEKHETVVRVEAGKAHLPNNFFSLLVAYECEPLGFENSSKVEYEDLLSSYLYKERVVDSDRWSECEACCEENSQNVITEKVYFKQELLKFHYHNPILLSLGKTFNKNACHGKCRNKYVRDNPNEITISGTTLHANFNEGDIYMQYYGLPIDEDGHVDIPDTKNGHLETYLEYYLKRRLAEDLIANNDAKGLQNMYSVFAQQEQISLKNASSELKMSSLKPSFAKRLKRLNRLEMLQYESALTW